MLRAQDDNLALRAQDDNLALGAQDDNLALGAQDGNFEVGDLLWPTASFCRKCSVLSIPRLSF
ncbi:MAG TPA: hypothetical protein V6D08_13325 [Candidatus Obscuribacterales bacterium]